MIERARDQAQLHGETGESPANHSVMDIVASKPGMYVMTIDVLATAVPTGQTQNVRDRVSVVVR